MTRTVLAMAVMGLTLGCEPMADVTDLGAAPKTNSAPLSATPFLPSLSPHRMAVLGDRVLIADPEGAASDGRHPQVHLLDLHLGRKVASFDLPDGANPGAVEVNAVDGKGYVVARGLGGIYQLDLEHQSPPALIPTCAAPIDLASVGGSVVVACRSGELVTITGGATHKVFFAPNLTSIASDAAGHLYVGTAQAQILEVGGAASTATPNPVDLHDLRARRLVADSARRLVSVPQGPVVMLFQQSIDGELLPLEKAGTMVPGQSTTPGGGGYGGLGSDCPIPAARPAMARFTSGGGLSMSRPSPATLAVDLAASPDGVRLAVADGAGKFVHLSLVGGLQTTTESGCFGGFPNLGGGLVESTTEIPVASPIAVAFAADGRLLAVNGSPNLELQVFDATTFTPRQTIDIRPRQVPAGFTLFHARPDSTATPLVDARGANSSLACASCHPDGLSNGAVTTLGGVKHKVMTLAGRLATAPTMHWDAKPFHDAIIEGTWKTQMGGPALTTAQEASLHAYLGQLEAPAGLTAEPAQLQAGKAAFGKAECGACHLPEHGFTNGGVADVGQGLHKVPSLKGLAYSAPYMSNGCAKTLDQRLTDDSCGGGAQHGKPSRLDAEERAALVAYLQSL